jgi:hypothetical protein
MGVRVLKTLNPKISIGKYSLTQIAVFTVLAVIILFNNFLHISLKIFAIYLLFKFIGIYKQIRGKKVRSYLSHFLYSYGLKIYEEFPSFNKKNFGG